jgi:predicted PurR-regulated permease PerM
MPLLSFALYAIIAALTFYLLIVGKALLLPVVVAIVFWYLTATLATSYRRIHFGRHNLPGWLSLTLAILTFVALLTGVIEMARSNVDQVVAAAPVYQTNLENLIDKIYGLFGIQDVPTISQLLDKIDLDKIATQLASALTSFAGNVGVILVYVLFLLVEQSSFNAKMEAIFPDPQRRAAVRRMIDRINADVRTYIWIKTVLSVLTGGVSYVVMRIAGVDFAEFWAVIIFLLNYIPTIGSILGIVFPAILALVQFNTLEPFLIVLVGIGAAQVVIGNVLEPRMMGKTLNLSPVVILFSLALWGTIWGIIGMFLCGPLTGMAVIVMARGSLTRPVAMFLSATGKSYVWDLADVVRSA